MTGLSVLYAKEAAEEREWAAAPERDKTGRLREVYWARRAESKLGRKSFASVELIWRPDRGDIGRRRDEPGDGFIYLVTPGVEDRFEWLEVTEVFTTVSASQIQGAMRAWNGIPDKHPVDFQEFRMSLPRGRPSRVEQRKAADEVIARIGRKLAKASYRELLEKYGYGTLVVGLPLWFAVPSDAPFRPENAIDDFMTRTALGLEDVRRRVLGRRDCPFRNVIVIWDTTPQALREWRETRSVAYEDAATASLENPVGASVWVELSDAIEGAVIGTGIPESEVPSIGLHLDVKTGKKASGNGPYPEFVEAFGKTLRECEEKPLGPRRVLKWRVAEALCKLLCLLRIHGVEGLERWVARKFSVSHAWRARAARRRARRFYCESRRRGRDFGGPRDRERADGDRRRSRRRGAVAHSHGGSQLDTTTNPLSKDG